MKSQHELNEVDRLFGLIGYPLSHSFSKRYFNQKFVTERISDHYYELFPLESIELFPALIRGYRNLVGLNVTLPYKQVVIPYLASLDEGAAAVGAVNTIKVTPKGLIGYNTDVLGFETSLLNFFDVNQVNPKPLKALILGTGGAAKAVEFVLYKLRIPFLYVSRTKREEVITYQEVNSQVLEEYQLIINTTPLGMSPRVETAPNLPYEKLTSEHLLFDLVYNPENTLFLKRGKEQGAATQNGMEMLILQAERAWEVWNGEAVRD